MISLNHDDLIDINLSQILIDSIKLKLKFSSLNFVVITPTCISQGCQQIQQEDSWCEIKTKNGDGPSSKDVERNSSG